VLRAVNNYGDPNPWSLQRDETFTVLSFLNCHKYPPSLLFLLMTLGPAVLMLAFFERGYGWLGHVLLVFGRVPLFFYLIHLPLIFGLAVLALHSEINLERYESIEPFRQAGGLHFSLPAVYATWMIVVTMLFPPCWWFASVKQRHKAIWLSYL
jgi:hypothetical protein